MKNKLITIVIPTYNRADYLREAIDSVLSQTYQDFELLICDNASTDNTPVLIKNYNDSRIKYYRHQTNIGMQQNWRFALSYPNTPFIALLSDDDLLLPHHIGKAVNSLQEHSLSSFYSCATETFGTREPFILQPFWLSDLCTVSELKSCNRYSAWLRGTPVASPSLVIRRSAFSLIENWGGTSWPACMDFLWWGQLAMAGSYIIDPEIGARYRWHESNISHEWYGKKRTSAVEYRYTVRELANMAFRKGFLKKQDVIAEAMSWSAREASTLVIALADHDSDPTLRQAAMEIFELRQDLKSNQASGHTRLAGILGPWYLGWADKLDRFIAKWPPRK